MSYNKLFGFIVLLFLLFLLLRVSGHCQTDSTNVSWDPNPESDILEYRLERSIDYGAFSQVASIPFPTTETSDRPPSPMQGHSYSYRLVAVDSASNISPYSDTVTVGIPDFIATAIPSTLTGQAVIPLNNVYMDPDNFQVELAKTFASQVNCAVSITATDLIITPPNNFLGSGSFYGRVDDPSGWWDGETVNFSIDTRDVTPPSAPTNLNVFR